MIPTTDADIDGPAPLFFSHSSFSLPTCHADAWQAWLHWKICALGTRIVALCAYHVRRGTRCTICAVPCALYHLRCTICAIPFAPYHARCIMWCRRADPRGRARSGRSVHSWTVHGVEFTVVRGSSGHLLCVSLISASPRCTVPTVVDRRGSSSGQGSQAGV